jgi:DNA repair exonuclease SbcCD ATPase subunit
MGDFCRKHNVPKLEYANIDEGTQMICPVCSKIHSAKYNIRKNSKGAKEKIKYLREEINTIVEETYEENNAGLRHIEYMESHPQEVYDAEVQQRIKWKAEHEAEERNEPTW